LKAVPCGTQDRVVSC